MRLVILALLLAPFSAHAAPLVALLPLVLSGTALVVAQVVLTVGLLVYGSAQQKKAARRQRDAHNAALQDRTVSRIATEAPHVYVYGRAKVGSAIVAMFTSGDKDQYKHMVCVHAAHECDGIEEVYVAGQKLGPLDADGFPTSGPFVKETTEYTTEGKSGQTFTLAHEPHAGSILISVPNNEYPWPYDTSPVGVQSVTVNGKTVTLDADYGDVIVGYRYTKRTPFVRVRKHLGTPNDPADASLIAEVPSKWGANHVLRGFCYTVIRLDLNESEFQGGPPTVEVLLRGKKLYDYRTGTTAWSQNNALVAYDYLTSELCGVDASDLPLAQFIAAANVCDESISGLGARYTFNGTVTSDEDQAGVLERMAQSMAGGICSTTWDIWAGKYTAPVMALDQSDTVGKLAITPGISGADLYNTVRGQYISADTLYVATDFRPYQSPIYAEADGRELQTNIDFPYTDTLQRVHNLARIFTEDQRNGFTFKADFSLKAWGLKVGERVTFTSPFFGQTEKVYRVTDKKYAPGAPVELTLKEDDPSIWDFADAVEVDATPNTDLPNPFAIAALGPLTCASGAAELMTMADGTVLSRMRVAWAPAETQAVFAHGMIEIEWQRPYDDNGTWQKISVSGQATEAYLHPVVDRFVYVVRARAYNPIMNTRSDWSYAYHRVIGKASPPPIVSSFSFQTKADKTRSFSFTLDNPPADVRSGGGFRIKYRTGESTATWADMTELHTGILTQSPYETNNPSAAGTYDFAIVVVDSSGNESAPVFINDVGVTDEPSGVSFADIPPGSITTEMLEEGAATDVVSAEHAGPIGFANNPIGVKLLGVSYTNSSSTDLTAVANFIFGYGSMYSSAGAPYYIRGRMWRRVYVGSNTGSNYESQTQVALYELMHRNYDSGTLNTETFFTVPANRRVEIDFNAEIADTGGGICSANALRVKCKIEVIKR